MAESLKDINQLLKIKLLVIYFFSNIIVYLLSSTTEAEVNLTSEESFDKRADYSEVLISAKLHTSFKINKPVSIYNKNFKQIAPYALLLEKKEILNEDSFTSEVTEQSKYLIYVHKDFITKLLKAQKLYILPYGDIKITPNLKRSKTYEITL